MPPDAEGFVCPAIRHSAAGAGHTDLPQHQAASVRRARPQCVACPSLPGAGQLATVWRGMRKRGGPGIAPVLVPACPSRPLLPLGPPRAWISAGVFSQATRPHAPHPTHEPFHRPRRWCTRMGTAHAPPLCPPIAEAAPSRPGSPKHLPAETKPGIALSAGRRWVVPSARPHMPKPPPSVHGRTALLPSAHPSLAAASQPASQPTFMPHLSSDSRRSPPPLS